MRVFELNRTLTVPKPLNEVFTFFSDPHNLEAITPPWMHFGIRSISDPEIREGTEIHYGLKDHGLGPAPRIRRRAGPWALSAVGTHPHLRSPGR